MAEDRQDKNWVMESGGLAFNWDKHDADAKSIPPPRGIFAEYPGFTPKYARNTGQREDTDFRESMARLFLQVTDYKKFVASFDKDLPSRQIASVLAGTVSPDGNTNVSETEGNGYIDFLLQSVQQQFQEKSQIIETLGDDHIAYFFGQAAPTFLYGGTLINTKQDDQAMNMLRLYRDMGRGTQLAKLHTLISIRYDGLIVSGTMTNLNWTLTAEMETAVPFSFNLLVKQVLLLPNKYGGLVPLGTPFASAAPGSALYLPFANVALDLPTNSVKTTMAPPVASAVAPAVNTDPVSKEPVPDFTATETMLNDTVPVVGTASTAAPESHFYAGANPT